MSTPAPDQTTALGHIRVLDLSRILAGPWAGQMLADLGAEVIKVEHPERGDDTRGWGPPWLRDEAGEATRESSYFQCANRGKQSVAIDMATPAGQDLIRQLAAQSDIVLENFKVGGLAKYGLDYASLSALHPRLIYCSITGFGQTGPYRHRAGYDFMIQGMGGLMSVTGLPDGEPGAEPVKVGVALADVMTGLYASNACLAALAYREQTGVGQHIDLALLDVQVATLANQGSAYLASGQSPGRLGNAHPSIVPYQAFAAADGHFILAVGNDTQFARLCELLLRPRWTEAGVYRTNSERVSKRAELIPVLKDLLQQQPVAYWLTELAQRGIPCGPINTIEQALTHEQVLAREMVVTRPHPVAGKVRMVASPIKLSASPVIAGAAPPLLGEHTEQVLSRVLALETAACARLRADGVIA